MLIWRRWIFPALVLIVCGAIAAAMVKLAFFPDADTASAIEPGGSVTTPTVMVERGEITDALALDGTIARDDAVTVRSTVDGTITNVAVTAGQSVAAGQLLFQIKQTYPVKTIDVVAPEAGDVGEVPVVIGQMASIGGDLIELSPARFHVVATVEPIVLYRLIDAPTEAQVSIQGGPAPFSCGGLAVSVGEDGTTSVECAIPADQQVFAGLQASVAISVGSVSDALVLPATAISGGSGTGLVWVDAGGELEQRDITLGITDGTLVEVTGGLEEGESVRQFVPGQLADEEPVCYDDGLGGQYCEDPGLNW